MFKSLRWRLQVWHAVVLLVVLGSFGAIVYRLYWETRLQQVDAELDRTASIVKSQLRRLLPRFRLGPRRPRRTDGTKPEAEQSSPAESTFALPQARADQARNEPDPPRNESDTGKPAEASGQASRDRPFPDPGPLPEEFQQLFHGEEDSRLYFVIWGGNGDLLQKSESAPPIDYPNLHVGADELPPRYARSRTSDQIYREVIHAGMFDLNFLVGRSLEKDLAAQHRSGLFLITTGLVILAAGTLGGGWLSARAIRPIAAMAATAESISAQNLTHRINVKETDSELGNLAKVLNRTFDRLQAAFERQSQFTADASHELRTPLSVIAAHTELALSRPRSNDDYRSAIETCRRASQRMKSLIDSLLILARFDAGTPSLREDQVDLVPLIGECVELVQPLANERGIRIEVAANECDVRGDRDRLSQVITNLLTNSIRYNVDAGHVRVATRVDGSRVVISVIDTGIGIAEDQLPLIFDRFYQIDKARSRAEGSCGLGLSICKTIVTAHRGTIVATSSFATGTTIEVRLPLAPGMLALQRPALNEKNQAPPTDRTAGELTVST
jgi:two-component system OmpR family sensor kinase